MDPERQKKIQEVVAKSLRLRDKILKFMNVQMDAMKKEGVDFADAAAITNIALSQAFLANIMAGLMEGDEDTEKLREIRNEALVEAVQLLRGSRVGDSDEPE